MHQGQNPALASDFRLCLIVWSFLSILFSPQSPMKRSLMAITLSSLLPLISFGNIISPPSAQATHKCEKWIDFNPFIEGSTCVWGALSGHGGPSGYLYDLIPEWEDLGLPCPKGYTCGYEEMMKILDLDPKAVFRLAGYAAVSYFLPQLSNEVILFDSLYETGRTGASKITEILEFCNWPVNQKSKDIVIESIKDNTVAFGRLLYDGGIKHVCNNSHLWLE